MGVVSFGYADGFMRCLSNRAVVYYRGKPYPVAGNITMDLTAVVFGNVIFLIKVSDLPFGSFDRNMMKVIEYRGRIWEYRG